MANKFELKAHAKLRLIADFFHKFKRYPTKSSFDSYEANLGASLYYYRKALTGTSKRYKFYPSMFALAKELGLPGDCFTREGCLRILRRNREDHACKRLREVAEFFKRYNRYPSARANTFHELKLGTWLSSMRRLNSGKVKYGIFYKCLKPMARRLLLPDNWCVTGCHGRGLNVKRR